MFEAASSLSPADRNKLAAVASIIPGAGHLLKGHRMMGFLILIAGNPLMIFVAFWLALATFGVSFVLVPFLWFVGVAASAYRARDLTTHSGPTSRGAAATRPSTASNTENIHS